MGLWSDFTGALDHAAGSTDEAVARQFDDTEGGGVVDETVDTAQEGLSIWERSFENATGIDYEWTGVEATDVGYIFSGPAGWTALAVEQQVPDDPISEVIDESASGGSSVYTNPDDEGDDDTAMCGVIETVTGLSCSEVSLAVRALIVAVVLGAALWLLRPVLEIVSGIVGGSA